MGMQELLAGIPDRAAEIEAMNPTELMDSMVSLVGKHANPLTWVDFSLTPKAEANIKWLNDARSRKLPFDYAHLKDITWKASFIKVDESTPVMTETDSKVLMAMVKKHAENVGRASRDMP